MTSSPKEWRPSINILSINLSNIQMVLSAYKNLSTILWTHFWYDDVITKILKIQAWNYQDAKV